MKRELKDHIRRGRLKVQVGNSSIPYEEGTERYLQPPRRLPPGGGNSSIPYEEGTESVRGARWA